MSDKKEKYGLKIKNFKSGALYGCNLGVRKENDTTNAMFVNSLFKDFLEENNLLTYCDKGKKSTRDIICIEFTYGTRSYEEEIEHLATTVKKYGGKLTKITQKNEKNEDVVINCTVSIDENNKNEVNENALAKIQEMANTCVECRENYDKKLKEDIREHFYVNGVDVEYTDINKKTKVKTTETIHYKMLYRTPGKAKKGSCMFINEKIYDQAKDFLTMGIKLPQDDSPIVEIGAYSSLVTSGIVGRVKINPKNILILRDVDIPFNTTVINVSINEKKECVAEKIEDYELKNTLFDGQALIDSSIFPEWADGYVLLRHHFCKMAAFNTNIQKFFKDWYGEEYTTATVKDMFGNEHYVKDIELITTDNAMKWLKFKDITYDYWCDWVYKNGCQFGIVKTAHRSKLGNVQRMSYQMINSLDINTMKEVCKTSEDYVELLKNNNEEFFKYLERNKNFSNDFEVLVALCKHNKDFVRSEYFRDRKRKIIEAYVLNLKSGKVIQEGDNLVIVGSPYAMLLHSVGEEVEKDDTFSQEEGTIQCYTERFNDGEYLAEFRNPFNGYYNLGYLHNVYHEKFKKYFNFGKQIIAVNMIGTDFQSRNNGLIAGSVL